jgi:hypothetical protein
VGARGAAPMNVGAPPRDQAVPSNSVPDLLLEFGIVETRPDPGARRLVEDQDRRVPSGACALAHAAIIAWPYRASRRARMSRARPHSGGAKPPASGSAGARRTPRPGAACRRGGAAAARPSRWAAGKSACGATAVGEMFSARSGGLKTAPAFLSGTTAERCRPQIGVSRQRRKDPQPSEQGLRPRSDRRTGPHRTRPTEVAHERGLIGRGRVRPTKPMRASRLHAACAAGSDACRYQQRPPSIGERPAAPKGPSAETRSRPPRPLPRGSAPSARFDSLREADSRSARTHAAPTPRERSATRSASLRQIHCIRAFSSRPV